jgi:hypothetical protein
MYHLNRIYFSSSEICNKVLHNLQTFLLRTDGMSFVQTYVQAKQLEKEKNS